MGLRALALNCTLKADCKEPSSTHAMIDVLEKGFSKRGVALTETVRLAALNILPGVTSGEGKGDGWPALRQKILDHDIVIFGSPIWMGQISSIAKRVLERMDAFPDETDEEGRMPSYGEVAVAAIIGNEDGAHGSSAKLLQALNDVGWTIPAVSACYWVGEVMGSTNFTDLKKVPEMVDKIAHMVAGNAAHLAALLQSSSYPG